MKAALSGLCVAPRLIIQLSGECQKGMTIPGHAFQTAVSPFALTSKCHRTLSLQIVTVRLLCVCVF